MLTPHRNFPILNFSMIVFAACTSSASAQLVKAQPGEVFRDCPHCPEMVVVPAGEFLMGPKPLSPEEVAEFKRKRGFPPEPYYQYKVKIAQPFAVGKFEVTYGQWDACVSDGGCRTKQKDWGEGRGNQPVRGVSWLAITKQYLPWLNAVTGKDYRLLSEAEWEYAARAGTTTHYFWGDDVGKDNANCSRCGSQWDHKQPAPVGSFRPNAFGLYDMHGNVSEWTDDCEGESGKIGPRDGSVNKSGYCGNRIFRGGDYFNMPVMLKSSMSDAQHRGRHYDVTDTDGGGSLGLGFRVGLTLNP